MRVEVVGSVMLELCSLVIRNLILPLLQILSSQLLPLLTRIENETVVSMYIIEFGAEKLF